MAIFGIGAYYGDDVSQEFIDQDIIGVGWSDEEAPELREYITALKVGDIVYIKAVPISSKDIHVKAIGIITDHKVVRDKEIVSTGRNVKWLSKEKFTIPKPQEKNNVRTNTIYEEFHPDVASAIISHINCNEGVKK